jgi:hypothetical protein
MNRDDLHESGKFLIGVMCGLARTQRRAFAVKGSVRSHTKRSRCSGERAEWEANYPCKNRVPI